MNTEVVITALVGVLSSLGGWFAARRKNLADVQSSELDNVEKAVKFYREQLEFTAGEWKKAIAELHDLQTKFQELANENRELITENKALIEELKKYKQLNGKRTP